MSDKDEKKPDLALKLPGELSSGVPVPSRSWMYEVPLFYFMLWGLQRAAFPEHHGFRDVNPNPYWLGVLLFALRYGMGAGGAAGVGAALLFILGVQQAGEGFKLEDSDFYLVPGLFAVVGLALGGVADRQAHRIAGLYRRIDDLVGRNRGLQNQIQVQQKAMRAVEQQIVSQMSSVVTLYHGSRELGTLDRVALLPAALDFFTQALQATKTAIYTKKAGRWILLDSRGWAEGDPYPKEVDMGEGIVGRAALERRVVSLRDMLVAEAENPNSDFKTDAIMAAPLVDPSGEPVAIFGVQAMPFLRFNSASVNLLMLLAEWGSESVAKAIHVEELKSRSLMDEDFGVHSATYFENRLSQEFNRCTQYALPLSIVLLGVDLSGLAPERHASAFRALAGMLRESVRNIDVVSRTPHADAPFAVMMMTSTGEQAQNLRERVEQALKRLDFPAPVRIGIGSFKHEMKASEELVEQARTQLR